MKNMLLWIAMGVLALPAAQASEISLDQNNDFIITNSRRAGTQPILFAYNNVNYALFPDGRLDFETPVNNAFNRRSNFRRYRGNSSRWNNIRYNRYGQVVQVGTTRIFYNNNGLVARIGQLDVDYYRGLVSRLGGLEVRYNNRGRLIAARGHVLVRNHYGWGHDCSTHDFGDFNEHDHQDDWDDGIFFKRKDAPAASE